MGYFIIWDINHLGLAHVSCRHASAVEHSLRFQFVLSIFMCTGDAGGNVMHVLHHASQRGLMLILCAEYEYVF